MILSIRDVLMPGKEQHSTERFPHHAHYITYCPSSSESMIILFALVLWEPYKLSYQQHLIIIDRGCDVTRTPLIWIIHVHLSVLGIGTESRLNIHTCCPCKTRRKLIDLSVMHKHLEEECAVQQILVLMKTSKKKRLFFIKQTHKRLYFCSVMWSSERFFLGLLVLTRWSWSIKRPRWTHDFLITLIACCFVPLTHF